MSRSFFHYSFLICVALGPCLVFSATKKPNSGNNRGTKNTTVEKNCDINKFDEHSANCYAQFGLDELRFPENAEELTKYCKKVKASNEFAKQYGENCLKSTSQTLMALASYNFDVVNKPYCSKKGKKKEDFVEWAKCGNPAKSKTEGCWTKMITVMGNAMKVRTAKNRIPLICCTYYEWMDCTRDQLASMGKKVCKQSTVDAYMEHINKASVDSMNLICAKYDNDKKKCEPYMKEGIMTRIKKPHKTPLLYVFEVFDKL